MELQLLLMVWSKLHGPTASANSTKSQVWLTACHWVNSILIAMEWGVRNFGPYRRTCSQKSIIAVMNNGIHVPGHIPGPSTAAITIPTSRAVKATHSFCYEGLTRPVIEATTANKSQSSPTSTM